MKLFYTLVLSTMMGFSANAQEAPNKKPEQLLDFTLGFGSSQTTFAASYVKNWNLGKAQKFYLGVGFRLSSAMGKNKIFTSAPASFASNTANVDSLYGGNANIYSLNTMVNMGYHISSKLDIGFNIDAVGFSFGPSASRTFRSNGVETPANAKPTSMNVLLVGNNDRGTLNSEFYIRYKVNNKVGIKLAVQHFFTELTTANKVQTLPAQNDRFRNITDLVCFGVAYHF